MKNKYLMYGLIGLALYMITRPKKDDDKDPNEGNGGPAVATGGQSATGGPSSNASGGTFNAADGGNFTF